jgi:hypothetical protein
MGGLAVPGQVVAVVRRLRRRHDSASNASAMATRIRIITRENDEMLTFVDRPRVRETLGGRASNARRVLRRPLVVSCRTTGAGSPPAGDEPEAGPPAAPPVADGMFWQYWLSALAAGPVHRPPGCTAYAGAAHTKQITSADSLIFQSMSMTPPAGW